MKYYKERYEQLNRYEGTVPVEHLLTSVLNKEGIEIDSEKARRIILMLLGELGRMFFYEPQNYFDFGKFVAYRKGSDKNNLITVEAKEGEDAETIHAYLRSGGLYVPELQNLAESFINGLLVRSVQAQKAAIEDIQKLTALTSQNNGESKQNK